MEIAAPLLGEIKANSLFGRVILSETKDLTVDSALSPFKGDEHEVRRGVTEMLRDVAFGSYERRTSFQDDSYYWHLTPFISL